MTNNVKITWQFYQNLNLTNFAIDNMLFTTTDKTTIIDRYVAQGYFYVTRSNKILHC